VALLLILFAGSTVLSVRAYVLYERATSTTSGVIRASNDLLIELLNAETGQRGYLLTKRAIYLQPYDRALRLVPADQQRLGSRVSAVPSGRQYLVELNHLATAKMAELARTVSLGRAGDHAAALRIVDTGEGKRIMDHARVVIADLQRAAAAAGASRRSDLRTRLAVFAVLAAILGAACVGGYLYLRRRLSSSVRDVVALADASRYVRSLIEASVDPLVTISLDGKITDVNEATVKITGVGRGRLVGTDFAEYFTEPDKAREGYQRVFAEGSVTDYPLIIHNGKLTPVLYNASVYRDPTGEVSGVFAAARDVTAQRQAEEQITRTAALLELAHDSIFVRDPGGCITYWNAGAERTYGFSRAEAVGRIAHDLLRTRFPEPLARIEATATRQSSWDGELTHVCADGRSIIVESRWAAQRGPGGSLLGFMEVNRDITARKETEHQMRRAAEQIRSLNATLEQQVQQRTIHLERANKSLEAFTYSIAHDLRTPLRGISGFAEVLLEDYGDRLDEAGRGYARRIQAGGVQIGHLIDDLLHLLRVTQAEMDIQDVDLTVEVNAVCDQLAARDPGRQVQVTVQDGVRAAADRALIRTVLENLLENAWKFTSHREDAAIEFATTPVEDAPICCYVRDNGAGFDPAYTGKLFQPFQRLHDASEFPGTGIGLASVRRIIDRHGGRTWAEGTVDHGATIYFTLNAKGAHE
jgi:PAS domain S-box-containing protein